MLLAGEIISFPDGENIAVRVYTGGMQGLVLGEKEVGRTSRALFPRRLPQHHIINIFSKHGIPLLLPTLLLCVCLHTYLHSLKGPFHAVTPGFNLCLFCAKFPLA